MYTVDVCNYLRFTKNIQQYILDRQIFTQKAMAGYHRALIFASWWAKTGITAQKISPSLSFWGNPILFSTVLHSLHSHQQCTRDLLPSHCHQHLLYVDLLMMTTLMGERWHLIMVVWICMSLMISVIEYFFKCILDIWMSSFGEVSIQALCLFPNWIVWLSGVELYKFTIFYGD